MKTSNINYYSSLLLIVVTVLFSLFSTNVTANDPVCISDQLITGQAVQVDWWFIIKIRGFSDLYYYYDSNMDTSGEINFKIGHFLRSRYSAFGATLLPYANAVLPANDYPGYTVATDTGFLAFGDSIKHGDKMVKDFYTYGAHEKGFIGWSTTKGGVGLFIQHSLPNFPYGEGTTMNPPIMNQRILTLIDNQFVRMHITQYGWRKNFFGKNLMPYYTPGKKFWKESEEPFGTGSNMVTRSGGTNYGEIHYINNSDFELFSVLYTTGTKPSQQIFCSSLIETTVNPPPTTPGKMVKDMVQYLSNLSDHGLFATKHSDNADQYFPHTQGFVSYRGSLATLATARPVDDEATNTRSYKDKTIQIGTKTYYMRITDGSDESNNDKGKKVDIWKSLTLNPSNQPKISNSEKFYISTWASKKQNSWWQDNDNIITPTFKVNVYGHTFTWKGNNHQEHSKIGFRKLGGNDWNVCSSGGNLYFYNKDGIKSSLLICFKSDGLRQALMNIIDASAVANDDDESDADSASDDDEKKPKKLSQLKEFIQKLQDSEFKKFFVTNFRIAEVMAKAMEAGVNEGVFQYLNHDDGTSRRISPRVHEAAFARIVDNFNKRPNHGKKTADANILVQMEKPIIDGINPELKRLLLQ